MDVTFRAPNSTNCASHDRGSLLTFGNKKYDSIESDHFFPAFYDFGCSCDRDIFHAFASTKNFFCDFMAFLGLLVFEARKCVERGCSDYAPADSMYSHLYFRHT
jgi:hypothetical protein